MNILEISNLNFIYNTSGTLNNGQLQSVNGSKDIFSAPALRDINIKIPKGSIVTVCGPTGCGKSTLLKLLKQEIAPAGALSGEIIFDGKPLSSLSAFEQASRIAILLQNPEDQIVTDKVWHELAYGLENLGYERSSVENRLAEMLSFFRLEPIARTDTDKLSGGQKQLVLLASLFAVSPELLLLDEPISQLDPETSELFIGTLKRLHEKLGTNIIIAEHKLKSLLPISDSVIVMDKGSVKAYGPYKEVKTVLEQTLPPLISEKDSCPAPASPSLSLKNIYFRYSLKSPDVLENLCADFQKGLIYAIFGCNAAGKTTLLNVISGLYKPQEGRIKTLQKKPKIAYLPQKADLLFISDTVKGELKASGISPGRIPEHIRNLDPARSPYDLSGGEKQLLALTKLIGSDPDIILLDEPTKGTDVILSKTILNELKRFTENDKIIIMSTHDIAFAKASADMCAIMSMGRLTAFKPGKEFFESNRLYRI